MTSQLEEQFALQLRALKLPEPSREHYFAKPRRWRFDFAFPSLKLAIEIDGATWSGGRHTRGGGFDADCEKLNTAALMGWTVLRFSGTAVRSGDAVRTTMLALNMKAAA
jgi:very-short-patch-repair endonuclease